MFLICHSPDLYLDHSYVPVSPSSRLELVVLWVDSLLTWLENVGIAVKFSVQNSVLSRTTFLFMGLSKYILSEGIFCYNKELYLYIHNITHTHTQFAVYALVKFH